jgi:hypothetical protein
LTVSGSTPQVLDDQWDASAVHARAQAQQLVLTSYERSALSIEEYAAIAIEYAESADEMARRKAVRKRRLILQDAWGPLLKEKVEATSAPEMQDRLMGKGRDNLDLSRNPAKRIWKEQAILYKFPPRRYTKDGDVSGKKYRKLVKRTKFNLFWKAVEEELQACCEVIVWPDAVEYQGETQIRHRYAAGDVVTLIACDDDPTSIECVLIHDERPAGKQYHLFTSEWHATFERNVGDDGPTVEQVGKVDEKHGTKNPYGRLTFHLLRLVDWQDKLFDSTSGEDLVDATLYGGVARVHFRYLQKLSGFKSLLAVGEFDAPERQLLDVGTIQKIQGSDATVSQLDWQLDLKAQQDVMDRDEVVAAASRGINPELYKHSANHQGARSAELAERPLKELRARMVPILDEAEAEYYKNACIVWAAHGVDDVPDPDAEFEIDFAPMAYPEDPSDQLEVDKKELAMGLTNHVALLQRRRPELSEDEARDIIAHNWEIISEVQKIKISHNIPDNPETESASAEENGRMGPAVRDNTPMTVPPGTQPETNSEKDQT